VIDNDYTDMLLASLPASYDSTVSSISASMHLSIKDLTAETFKQFILDEYKCFHVKGKLSNNKDEALAAEQGKGKSTDKHKDKHKVKCYNCCKTRHYKSKCWAKGGSKESQGPKHGKGAKEEAASAKDKKEEEQTWATIEEVEEPMHQ
jgi:hypothetical protein